jgi:hypothetical protein
MSERIYTPSSQTATAQARTWASVWQASLELSRDAFLSGLYRNLLIIGRWANDTALEFGSLVSALLAPAIVSAYLIAVWSITADMGITGEFIFTSGPFSNWIVWAAIAIVLHLAASVLRRRVRRDQSE